MKNKVKTILMTGATGFLGSNLLKKLVIEEYDVVILKRSFSYIERIKDCLDKIKYYDIDQVDLEKCFLENRIDVFIHCATNYGRKNEEPLQIIDSNLILPLKIVELGLKYHCPYFINTDTILDKRVNIYSLSKRQFLDWLKIYSDRAVCINVALEHFYGPGDDRTKFVSFMIGQLLNNVAEIDLTLGEQRRDFVYIDDVVEAFIAILKNLGEMQRGFFQYDIGAGDLVSLRDIVVLIKELAGNTVTKLKFGALPYRQNEIMQPKLDIAAIKHLGWRPRTLLKDGLAITLRSEKAKNKI